MNFIVEENQDLTTDTVLTSTGTVLTLVLDCLHSIHYFRTKTKVINSFKKVIKWWSSVAIDENIIIYL